MCTQYLDAVEPREEDYEMAESYLARANTDSESDF
jgi:hypothetical protein